MILVFLVVLYVKCVFYSEIFQAIPLLWILTKYILSFRSTFFYIDLVALRKSMVHLQPIQDNASFMDFNLELCNFISHMVEMLNLS